MLQLVRKKRVHAKAHLSCSGDRPGHGRVLLVSVQKSSSECGRLPLGDSSGAAAYRSSESIRHSAGTISPACSFRCAALLAHAAGDRRRVFLWNQFILPGSRTHARSLSQAAGFLRLSVLGRTAGGAMVGNHHSERVLSFAPSRNHDEAASWIAGVPHPALAPRFAGMCFRSRVEPGGAATVALAMAWTNTLLRTFYSPAGFSGTAAASRPVALPRTRCVAPIAVGNHAAAVVLR